MEVLVVFFFAVTQGKNLRASEKGLNIIHDYYYHVCVQLLLEKHQLDDFDRSSDAAFTTCIN